MQEKKERTTMQTKRYSVTCYKDGVAWPSVEILCGRKPTQARALREVAGSMACNFDHVEIVQVEEHLFEDISTMDESEMHEEIDRIEHAISIIGRECLREEVLEHLAELLRAVGEPEVTYDE